MSGGAEAEEVKAAHREYQHQREWILRYLSECKVTTSDKKAGGKLAQKHHYKAEFVTISVHDIAAEFLAVSDMRMQVGSGDEQVATAKLIEQFRRLLPTVPLTRTLAEVVRTVGSRNGRPGADKNKASARKNAEKVRDISDAATRNPDGTLAKPGGVGLLMGPRFGKTRLSPKTVKKYDDLNRGVGKVDDRPSEDRE